MEQNRILKNNVKQPSGGDGRIEIADKLYIYVYTHTYNKASLGENSNGEKDQPM